MSKKFKYTNLDKNNSICINTGNNNHNTSKYELNNILDKIIFNSNKNRNKYEE